MRIMRFLLLSIFLGGTGLPLCGSQEKPSVLFWKIPLYHEMPAMNLNSQVFGFVGFVGIACYMFYTLYDAGCTKLYGPKKKKMTLKDAFLLQLLLDCAARDMCFIRSGKRQALQVNKLEFNKMTAAYKVEAEYMRQQFALIAALYNEGFAAPELLESFYGQWRDAIERACISQQSLFARLQAAY